MRNLKSALLLRRTLSTAKLCNGWRRHTSLSCNPVTDDTDNLVVVEANAGSRTSILNRPSSLNAINTPMVFPELFVKALVAYVKEHKRTVLSMIPRRMLNGATSLHKLYESWEENPDIGFVVVKGAGRSFSAGGDIVALYNMIKQGNIEDIKLFFRTIYNLIYFVGTYLKSHVALLNGVTMGGGAGISIPGTFRVATDKTIFATPETLIGFHTDAAASFYLSHLPGYLGEYLALTGAKLNGSEMLSCGLATHFTPLMKLPLLEEKLSKLITDDPCILEASLANLGDVIPLDHTSAIHRIDLIDKCFSHDTVEEIIDSLKTEAAKTNDAWCVSTLDKLKEAAPLSLKVTLRSIREGRFQTLDQCLVREYRMSLQGMCGKITTDFCEGVRSKLVHKDFTPKWDPPSFEHVSQDMVDEYFTPLTPSEPELDLPTKQREAFT